jgi:hypothetical protein
MSVIVLGMHRSGTSLLIGLLGKYGFKLGEVSEQTSELKPTGTRENLELRKINNQLLVHNNASWENPKKCIKSNKNLQEKMSRFSTSLQKKNWAMKDPRMLLTYGLWHSFLPKHQIIATIRHPLLVARSLKIKNGMCLQKALETWFVYNRQLLELWNQFRFPILNFNESPENYFKSLKKLEAYLNIEIGLDVFNSFYNHTPLPPNDIDSLNEYSDIESLYRSVLEISEGYK